MYHPISATVTNLFQFERVTFTVSKLPNFELFLLFRHLTAFLLLKPLFGNEMKNADITALRVAIPYFLLIYRESQNVHIKASVIKNVFLFRGLVVIQTCGAFSE